MPQAESRYRIVARMEAMEFLTDPEKAFPKERAESLAVTLKTKYSNISFWVEEVKGEWRPTNS